MYCSNCSAIGKRSSPISNISDSFFKAQRYQSFYCCLALQVTCIEMRCTQARRCNKTSTFFHNNKTPHRSLYGGTVKHFSVLVKPSNVFKCLNRSVCCFFSAALSCSVQSVVDFCERKRMKNEIVMETECCCVCNNPRQVIRMQILQTVCASTARASVRQNLDSWSVNSRIRPIAPSALSEHNLPLVNSFNNSLSLSP